MNEKLKEVLDRRKWKKPEDAIAEMKKLGISPSSSNGGRNVPSATFVESEGQKWPMWRSEARDLVDAGAAKWA